MAKTSIPLGQPDQLKILFSYPNIPTDNEPLEQTILHWFGATLTRDGLQAEMASVRVDGNQFFLDLDGPTDDEIKVYADRFPKILKLGWNAWSGPIQQIMSRKLWSTDGVIRPMWDPNATGNWRFFLTLGVGIVNHRTLQFFHYPPQRLLNPLRDSMQDPVTYRCRDLLIANGVAQDETKFYETRINSTPIAAPDDQGTNNSPAADPVWGGLIPIGYFAQFESDMVKTLIKPHSSVQGYTIPLTAYGNDPRARLGGLFLGPDKAMVIEVLPGLKTPVLGSNHPYRFYATAQGGQTVGSGILLPDKIEACTQLQQDDLAVVRWQVEMARDPSQDPWQVICESQAYWKAPAQQDLVQALVRRHGSLKYDDPEGFSFRFLLDLNGNPEKSS